jgi:hypothetical protein
MEQLQIWEYLEQTFNKPDHPARLPTLEQGAEQPEPISTDEVRLALKKLSRNKASGIDHLKDTVLHAAAHNEAIIDKIAASFTLWYSRANIPKYLKTARVTCLSKEDSPFPEYGKIRPIAVLPSLTKLYETCIAIRLNKELKRCPQPLHASQRGFQPGRSVYDNLADIAKFMAKAKEQATADIRRKVKAKNRNDWLVLLLDFAKAFDTVDRQLLLWKLALKKISTPLTNAIAALLSGTQHQTSQNRIEYPTTIGVP